MFLLIRQIECVHEVSCFPRSYHISQIQLHCVKIIATWNGLYRINHTTICMIIAFVNHFMSKGSGFIFQLVTAFIAFSSFIVVVSENRQNCIANFGIVFSIFNQFSNVYTCICTSIYCFSTIYLCREWYTTA